MAAETVSYFSLFCPAMLLNKSLDESQDKVEKSVPKSQLLVICLSSYYTL